MNILFLCGSLEPGRDGVGDYVRQLAGELTRRGHHTSMLALNDEFINNQIKDTQLNKTTTLPTLRLPATWSIHKRFVLAQQLVNEFSPDWLSLQFVSFSFHNRGLPYGLNYLLAKIGKGRNWHLMFHELWVGMAINDTLKRKAWGYMQKILIKGLIKQLRPKVIHTQCTLYFEQLFNITPVVNKLPLFSNIEVSSYFEENSFKELNSSNVIKFVFFGGLHPQAYLIELIEAIKNLCISRMLDFEFLYTGRNGQELENHLTILQNLNVTYKVFGELSTHDISHLLITSTFGVSTVSPEMLEKSGTVAAMLTHGLPVICIGKKLTFKNTPNINLMDGTYGLDNIASLLSMKPTIIPNNTLEIVAEKYERDLFLKFKF